MSPATTYFVRLASIGMALLIMAILGCVSGCGGGDPEPDAPTPRVDCQTRPEVCQ